MPRSGHITTFAALLAAGAVAGGCGGSGESHETTRAKPLAPVATESRATMHRPGENEHRPVARIGDRTITLGTLRHWISLGSHGQAGAPEPPDYTQCIAYLRSLDPQRTALLREACKREYDGLVEPALSSLIHDRWLIDEARDEGLKVDEAKLKRESALGGPRGEEAGGTIETDGETRSDVKLKLLTGQLSARFYRKLERSVPVVTGAQISDYYTHHKQAFVTPEKRDMYILRTLSKGAAEKAKREVEGGASFATVVGKTSLEQPISSKHGLLLGLGPDDFGEPPLNRAIFSAPLNTLRGPVQISLGYYIFEVLHRHPPHQRSLAQVRSEIATQLHRLRRERIVSRFVAGFRKKWTSRTHCFPGYVVKYCRQYKQSEVELREAASVL
jgi:hypothetical protein